MSVPEQVPYKEYRATGSNNSFEITFYLPDPKDLVVMVNKEIPPVGAYSIQDNTVVFNTPPNEGDLVELTRDTQLDRETNFKSYDNSFRPETINFDLDKIWLVLQESNLVDAKILVRLKQEIEWRRTHDFNYDELAQVREKQLFDALKGYTDTLLASTNPGVFSGVTAGVVFAQDGKSIQTHLEEILANLAVSRDDINTKASLEYVDEQLDLKANSVDVYLKAETYSKEESYSKIEMDSHISDLEQLVNATGQGYLFYKTDAERILAKPTQNAVAKVLSTNKVWSWVTTDGGITGTWTDNGLSELDQAKNHTNQLFGEIAYKSSKNKYDPSKAKTGWRLSGAGALVAVAGAKHTGHIPVVPGKTYTASWSNPVSDNLSYAFFVNETDTNGTGYKSDPSISPRQITVPAGVNFIVINLKHGEDATERVKLQLEEGVEATNYEAFELKVHPQAELIKGLIGSDAFIEEIKPVLEKEYEIKLVSKNLFDESMVLENRYITNAGLISGSAGWAMSGFIPVVAGKTYILSGLRGRHGLSFYNSNAELPTEVLLYVSDAEMPLIVTAPAGSTYVAFNLESPTSQGWSQVQFEEGDAPTKYVPYGETKKMIDPSFILAGAVSQDARNVFSLNEGSGYIKSLVDDLEVKLNVKVYNPVTYTGSAVFNFNGDVVNDVTVRVNGDDTAPVRMMGATIGANHGYSRTILTLAGHGKTNADVGSVWTNGTKEYVILQIISTSQLAVTSRSDNTAFPSGGTLAHVSGATNTASFTPTNTSAAQWYPMLKNHKIYHSVDGVVSAENTGEWEFKDNVTIHESYDLMEKADIVQWLIANGAKEVKQYLAASALNVSNIYRFNTHGGVLGATSFYTKKALSAAQDLMFTQSARLTPGVNGDIKYYVPRSTPFIHESVNYDFTKLTNVNDLGLTSRIDFTAVRTEPGEALPDRLIQFNDLFGYATGYLPVLDAAPEKRNTLTTKGIQISNTQAKVYPYLVDGLTTLPEGTYYSALWYRQYFKRTAEQTAKYTVESPLGDFLYIDWHTPGKNLIELPPAYAGRQFEIVRKSSNVNLRSTVATTNLVVEVDNSKPYGYLELKFK